MERMKKLIKLLNEASQAYYQQAREIMSDYEYDKLYDELLKLEEESGIILSDSPTQKVGYIVLSNLNKVKHESKMLSLDKTKDIEKLKSFLGDNIGLLSLKMDGLTIVLKYMNGELIQAVTRGNGEIGEDITHNAKLFKNIPLKINYKEELIIRGEAVISYDEFKKINETLDYNEKYKNPRNLCSGTVRQLDSEKASKRGVNFIVFSLVKADNVEFNDLKSQQLNWLEKIGFQTVEYKMVTNENIESAVREFEENISENKFASDGLVLTYDSINYSRSLGVTSKFPKDSIAFKWADEISETKLLNIYWNTSRTGLINPIAIFEPVELEGTNVNRASLHNLSIVENLQLGIGDKITVYKANMIIPQIADNLTKSNTFTIPDKCPVCGEETEIIKLKDGKALKCINPNCKAQLVMKLCHYSSRNAMNIEGFSEATYEKFVEMDFINNYTDIYSLKDYKDKIIDIEGFGEKSFQNLYDSIEKSKITHLYNFIYALGIEHVGLSNAKLLCKYFNNNFDEIKNASIEQFIEIEGFGEVISKSLYKYFKNENNIKLIDKAFKYLTFLDDDIDNSDIDKLFKNTVFVITGELNKFENRKQLQEKIEVLGGKVTNSVSSKTNYLINNDINSNSSKNKKAKQLNVKIITEDDFIKMVE